MNQFAFREDARATLIAAEAHPIAMLVRTRALRALLLRIVTMGLRAMVLRRAVLRLSA